MKAGKRLWRTADGRLVEDGHADAAFLAYGVDDELSDADAELLTEPDPEPEAKEPEEVEEPKRRGRPPKSRAKPDDKAAERGEDK